MCGILGYIGQSKNSHITYELTTALLEKTESRGEDASGFWGVDKSGKILYHKEPTKATVFVQKDVWKKVEKYDPDLFLVHARAASFGFGSPNINKNNHPFTNADKSVGLIHNGRIQEVDYRALKRKYETRSECDSELYLRIFDSIEDRLASLKAIWSILGRSQMAIAIGERINENQRRLWLFRNKYRSIWLADLRSQLGQVFFFSTPDIWEEAVWTCDEARSVLKRVKLFELPTEEVWSFTVSKESPVDKISFTVKTSGNFKPWTFDGEMLKIPSKEPAAKLFTRLDDNEEVIETNKHGANCFCVKCQKKRNSAYIGTERKGHPDLTTGWDDDFKLFPDMSDSRRNMANVTNLANEIRKKLTDVEVGAENLLMEDSMSADDYQELVSSLESASLELEGTLRILDNLHR